MLRYLALAIACFVGSIHLHAESVVPAKPDARDPRVIDHRLPDLSEYRSFETAVTVRASQFAPVRTPGQPGYLGVSVAADATGQLVVEELDQRSPAKRAGLRKGDVLLSLNGNKIVDGGMLGDWLRSTSPGEKVTLAVQRDGDTLALEVTLAATSRPLSNDPPRATLGIQTREAGDGARVERLLPNSPAVSAGLKLGDIVLKVNDVDVAGPDHLQGVLSEKEPGDAVTLMVRRGEQELFLSVRLGNATPMNLGRGADPLRWDDRRPNLFRKPVYRLAVIPIVYPDVKLNPKITAWDWEQSLFSTGTYYGKSATGQPVHGSMNDYYQEISCGKLRVEGRVFEGVAVNRNRADYGNDRNRFALLTEVLDKLLARDGVNALADYDGLFFLYAGERVATNRGGLYWPHRASLSHRGQRWSYFICPEGGSRMANISVITHEFGHMLGLPDLYARPEAPGSEGLGIWCTMATGHGRDGRPLHFSAWCKERMGWLTPTVIDPTIKQKLVLAPITHSTKECFKVLIRPDGSEYLLLENRVAKTFDRDLPAEGLLIWRVVDGRPVLEESHGIAGPEGPGRYLTSVPYPSGSNNAFTPYTTPSSRSLKGGGRYVHITNITRLPDGRVSFHIGYEMQ